jgi:hypothetical protein
MGWMANTAPLSLYPRGRDPVPILQYKKLVGPQDWPGRVREITPPPEFDPIATRPDVNIHRVKEQTFSNTIKFYVFFII